MVGLRVGVSMIGVLRENQSVSSWPSPGEVGVRVLLSEAVKWTLEFPLETGYIREESIDNLEVWEYLQLAIVSDYHSDYSTFCSMALKAVSNPCLLCRTME